MALAVAAGLVLGTVPAGGAAHAAVDGRYVCEGRGGMVDAAEVYVPPGVQCVLVSAYVAGDVVVSDGARFSTESLEVGGDVRAYRGATVGFFGTVAGDVRLSEATASIRWGRVEGSIRGRGRVLSLFRTSVGGSVTYDASERVYLGNVSVAGWFAVHGGHAELWYGTFARGVTLSGSRSVVACALTVTEDFTVRWSHGSIRVGPGGNRTCDPEAWIARYVPYHDSTSGGWNGTGLDVGGSVLLVDNPHSIWFRRSRVAGDLVCTGTPGPRASTSSSRWSSARASASAPDAGRARAGRGDERLTRAGVRTDQGRSGSDGGDGGGSVPTPVAGLSPICSDGGAVGWCGGAVGRSPGPVGGTGCVGGTGACGVGTVGAVAAAGPRAARPRPGAPGSVRIARARCACSLTHSTE